MVESVKEQNPAIHDFEKTLNDIKRVDLVFTNINLKDLGKWFCSSIY